MKYRLLLATLMAGAAVLTFGGGAFAADQPQASQPDSAKQQGGAEQANSAADKDAYFAALSKCDAMKGVAEKQQCVDTVRKQYGQM